VDGTHGLFSGLIILNSDHYDVNVTGSVDGRPGVEVAATDTQECVRHPGSRWHCADILGDTRFPLLDDLTVIPFLKAERKGPVLFAGTVVEHGRILDHYMVLNDVDRVIDVAIDRHTGYLATVYLHQNALAVYDVQATYSDWNASDVSFPMLPATSS
jgi:hypothetical protein